MTTPLLPVDHFNEGKRLSKARAWADAVASFGRALAADPTYWQARFGQGLARQWLGDHQNAVADFDAVLAVRPDLPDAWYGRGVSNQALSRHLMALADAEQTLRLRQHADAQYLRANSLKSIGRHADAMEELNRLLVADPLVNERRQGLT